jgi:hypothetical protein
MKIEPIKYSRTVTFGRFNIGHLGHIRLFQKMLYYGEQADVFVSTGKENNDWDLRVLLLKSLCRRENVPLCRVNFLKAKGPFKALRSSVELEQNDHTMVALVLGSDQSEMGLYLEEKFDIPFIENERINSSTNVRFLVDRQDPFSEELLQGIYDDYPLRLAKLLRREEKLNEKRSGISKATV